MKKGWLLFDLILSIFIGLYINYFISSEIISRFFQGSNSLYTVICIIALIMQILFIFVLIRLCRTKKISKYPLRAITILYIFTMIVLLFGRPATGASISMNILELFNFSDRAVLFQNIFNIIFFLPIGYLFKNSSTKNAVICSFIGVIIIELIQLLTYRGIFDICDIILNIAGILIGYYLSKKINAKLAS